MEDFKLEWASTVKFMKGTDKTIVANIDNAKGIFVANECLKIIDDANAENLSFCEVLDCIEDAGSREYFERLVKQLDALDMWKYREHPAVLGNEMEISVDITNDCNLRCKHCCVSAGDNIRGEDVSTEKVKEMLKKVINLGPRLINISGGEPLIRKDFKELTEFIRESYSGVLVLMTNAILVDDEMAAFIAKQYDVVDTSIDGVDEETCSKIRGKGTFAKTVEGIRKLVSAGCKVSASMLVTEDNKHLKSQFGKLCKEELGVEYIFRTFDPVGRGANNKEDLEVSKNSFEPDEICWERCEKKFVESGLYKKMPQIFACQGAKREFQIDHKGDIYPCASMMEAEFVLGNLYEVEDFSEYILKGKFKETEGYKNFAKYLPYNVPECKECNKQLLCFSCTNTVKKCVKNNTIENVCKENDKYYDLYWRYYGTC